MPYNFLGMSYLLFQWLRWKGQGIMVIIYFFSYISKPLYFAALAVYIYNTSTTIIYITLYCYGLAFYFSLPYHLALCYNSNICITLFPAVFLVWSFPSYSWSTYAVVFSVIASHISLINWSPFIQCRCSITFSNGLTLSFSNTEVFIIPPPLAIPSAFPQSQLIVSAVIFFLFSSVIIVQYSLPQNSGGSCYLYFSLTSLLQHFFFPFFSLILPKQLKLLSRSNVSSSSAFFIIISIFISLNSVWYIIICFCSFSSIN